VPRNTHGGFDQVVEISNFFFEDQAKASMSTPSQEISSNPGDAFQFSGRLRTRVRSVWFGDAAETFDANTGAWKAAPRVAPFNGVVIALEIDGYINIKKITVQVGGSPVTVPVPYPQGQTEGGAQRLNVHIGITVLAPLSVEQLAVRSARDENYSTQRVPCAVVILPSWDLFYNIKIDMAALRSSPFTTWAVDLVNAFNAGDPEQKVIQPMVAALNLKIKSQLKTTLPNTCDYHIDRAGRIALAAPRPELGVTGMDVRAAFDSIRVFLQTTGAGGQSQAATRSQLQPASTSRDADAMVITVNGEALVRSLRGPLAAAFPGLSLSDFIAAEPCTVNTPVAITMGGRSYTLLYLQAGVDESSHLILWLFLRASMAGSTADIEIELPINFTASRAVRAVQQGNKQVMKQVLVVSPRKGQARYAVSVSSFPGVHWILQAIAEGMLGDTLRRPLDFAQQTIDMAQTQLMEVLEVDLHQNGAPRQDRTWPGMRLIGGGFNVGVASEPGGLHPGRFRDHDLVIHLGSGRYPSPLNISCIQPDDSDPMRRINSVGGSFSIGPNSPQPWAMPVDDAIGWVSSGRSLTAGGVEVIVGRKPRDCPPANPSPGNLPYLRTRADQVSANNLAEMTPCVSAGDVTAPSTTLESDTFVHWRDVLPFGDTGNDIVNDDVQLDMSCVVADIVLEMVTREGVVLATHRFGGPDAVAGGGGARMTTNPIGTNSLAVTVYWWFDAYQVCRYRLIYTLQGLGC
jgi:hypothetical protein